MELPLAPIENLVKHTTSRYGINRVGTDAVKAMAEILEEKCIAISKEAHKLAKHAKRVTIKEEDIKLAKID